MTYQEENNYPKAIAIATVVMGLLIAISFIWVIESFKPEEELGMGGIVVNYGTAETGMGNDYTSIDEPSVDPNANNKMPDKITPEQKVTPNTSSDIDAKDILTQSTEDAVAVNTKTTKSSNTSTPTTEAKPAQPTINPNALYKGKKNNGTGGGDGTGNTPGNQGDVDGDPLAPFYGDGGSGFGNKPLPLSNFKNLQKPEDDGQETGTIMVKILVNRQGRVIRATAGAKGSTFSNDALNRKCEQSMMNASLNAISSGPETRVFYVPFVFRVK